jgi:hypothetical protein
MATTKKSVVGHVADVRKPQNLLLSEGMQAPDIQVHFDNGEVFLLASHDQRTTVFAEVLESLKSRSRPVYLEVDQGSGVISDVLIPFQARVLSITSNADGRLAIELEGSHAVHYLAPSTKEMEDLSKKLRDALETGEVMTITESESGHRIIDVRESENPSGPRRFSDGAGAAGVLSPSAPIGTVSMQHLQELFKLVSGFSCLPASPSAPCIPFLYPDDGCYARAHQMCRLLIKAGEQPAKMFLYGNPTMIVHTKNIPPPGCQIAWFYHVAPVLQVGTAVSPTVYVLDPSLLSAPGTDAQWKTVQSNSGGMSVITAPSVYFRSPTCNIQTDDNYQDTEKTLADFRDNLKLRTAKNGPPPYAGCP